MKTGIFIVEIEKDNKIKVPSEIISRLNLNDGDKLEITLKKIKSKKLDLNIGKNPLTKMLK